MPIGTVASTPHWPTTPIEGYRTNVSRVGGDGVTRMTTGIDSAVDRELAALREQGLYKSERPLESPQSARVTSEGRAVINLCANNYLGLANHPEVIAAAHAALDRYGFGLASVRFICGTQTIHKQLEAEVSEFLTTEDTILYASCFDANAGLFETLLGPEDAVISDALNHASIIDGIRLCKAKRLRYANNDMDDLRRCLEQSRTARRRIIATDGVFSMDGTVANLAEVCELADQFDALVMVDDSHAVGFMGPTGRGTPEHCGVQDRIDIVTGTFGKALGGASGGYTSGSRAIIDLLRQRSRPYLFSNTVAPMVVGATLKVLDLLRGSDSFRQPLWRNTDGFRAAMAKAGFAVSDHRHPIVPIIVGDAAIAGQMADQLFEKGVYAVAFSYPVVPKATARIRVQLSASHTDDDVSQAVAAFAEVGGKLGLLGTPPAIPKGTR